MKGFLAVQDLCGMMIAPLSKSLTGPDPLFTIWYNLKVLNQRAQEER